MKKNIKLWRLKNIKLNTFPVYSTRCKKLKKTYVDKVYITFNLNVLEDRIECKSLIQSFPLIL